jgi:8-oxo-dGTP pyrophosphatase MutT (NUDIX family)
MMCMSDTFRDRLAEALHARPPRRAQIDDARDAAVLIPIVATPEPTVIFTVRTDTVGTHKGQISFPGGAIDTYDSSPAAAALRETHEEIGLDPAGVEILGELDSFPTFVSGYVVTPFVGWLDSVPDLRPSPAEVAEVLHVPIAELTEEIRAEPGFGHGGRTFPTEAWIWGEHVIWGVTARIVRYFLALLAEAGLAAAPGNTTSWTAWPVSS